MPTPTREASPQAFLEGFGRFLEYFVPMELLGTVADIWRYPTKSLAAQALESTEIESAGLPGDRAQALMVRAGHAREGKTYRGKEHNLLHTVDNAWEALRMAADRGVNAAVASDPDERFFDAAPVSVLFDTWVAQAEQALRAAFDPRRWRPNFYVRAAPGVAVGESDLEGAQIELGNALLRITAPTKRCVTPSYDLESGESNGELLRWLAQHRANVMGVYCVVERAGTVRVGDALRLRAR